MMQAFMIGGPEIRLKVNPDIGESRDYGSGGGIRLGVVSVWPAGETLE